MSRITKTALKTFFETNDTPSQADFSNFIDTTLTPIITTIGSSAGLIATDAAVADIFRVTLSESVVISNPTNVIDGQAITWYLTQGTGGNFIITLDSKFVIPATASPIAWSTTAGLTDILSCRYNAAADKFMVFAAVPGFSL